MLFFDEFVGFFEFIDLFVEVDAVIVPGGLWWRSLCSLISIIGHRSISSSILN